MISVADSEPLQPCTNPHDIHPAAVAQHPDRYAKVDSVRQKQSWLEWLMGEEPPPLMSPAVIRDEKYGWPRKGGSLMTTSSIPEKEVGPTIKYFENMKKWKLFI